MKNTLKSFLNFIRVHKTLSIIGVLILVGIVWYVFSNNSEDVNYTAVTVNRGSISEIVSVTGNVRPLSAVDLAFERGGRVANISVAVDDKVYAGQFLASVSNADLVASLSRARADLDIAEVPVSQNSKIEGATLDLAQVEISLVNIIRDSYTKADDAIRNKMFSLFTDPNRYNAKLSFTTDVFLKEVIERGRNTISDTLDFWYQSLISLSNDSDLRTHYSTAKFNLDSIKGLLDNCATAVNGLSPEGDFITQTQIDTWKANISTARANIDLAITTLVGAQDQYQTAILALKTAKSDFTIQGLTVEQAKASVASAEAELAKSIIRSPIDGVITNIISELGEIVSANKNIISVISYGDYEVETFVPEADISKIKIGNPASTTLDAYGSDVNFETTVIKIDPAATVIDGVPTYKVTLKFINQDERIKSGMTANLDILTNRKEGVLVLPSRVIVSRDDGKCVSVVDSADPSEILEKNIVTGLRGSDGNVEIISGLNEGEKVVTTTTQ